jgi:acetyltransferase EpsM
MATAGSAAQAADSDRSAGPVTARPLVIVGGGEHALVVLEAARSAPDRWTVVGFTDRSRRSRLAGSAPAVDDLGDDDALAARLPSWTRAGEPEPAPALILGIGGGTRPGDRVATVDRLGQDADWATVVHAAATVSPSARLGPGTVVGAAAVVQAEAVAGRHVIVNTGAVVEHDVVLGEFTHVGPAAAIGGGTRIGARVFIGLGARIRDHVTIGDDATIGMGAVVLGDVAAGGRMVGVPARDLGPAPDPRR